jgi:hypothetical protein
LFSRLEKFAVSPCLTNLVNIATCDPTLYRANGRYHTVVGHNATKDNPVLFYTVGIVRHSDLFTGDKSRQICVVPSDLVWNRAAAVMGKFFNETKLAFGTFYNGISFSTLKRKDKGSASDGQLSSFGMSSSSSSKRMTTSCNAPLPYNADGM